MEVVSWPSSQFLEKCVLCMPFQGLKSVLRGGEGVGASSAPSPTDCIIRNRPAGLSRRLVCPFRLCWLAAVARSQFQQCVPCMPFQGQSVLRSRRGKKRVHFPPLVFWVLIS